MLAQLQDGDIIDSCEVELISSVVDSLAWIIAFCDEHPERVSDGAEFEWLEDARKLVREAA